jgi:hypothetical protein
MLCCVVIDPFVQWNNGTTVALKKIANASDEEFVSEVNILMRLRHPNIVQV